MNAGDRPRRTMIAKMPALPNRGALPRIIPAEGDTLRRGENAMLHRIGASNIAVCVILLISVSWAYAADAPQRHPSPWPIRHWRNHQPLRSDITPQQARDIKRLYMQREQKDPELLAPRYEKKPPQSPKS
jgi:hypothetical protein